MNALIMKQNEYANVLEIPPNQIIYPDKIILSGL